MATVYQHFTALDGVPPASNYATFDVVSGSNFPVPCLDFDTTTAESIYFFFRASQYGSGNLTIDIDWYADTASSGNVVWDAQLGAITPNTDSTDIETKALGTANTVTDSHLGTTGQRLHRATITLSNLDSLAADDWCVLKITRDVSDGADTMAGDACLVGATVSYSDT
jgi:hypothetical protein